MTAFEKDENSNGVLEKKPIPFSTTWSMINTLNYEFKKTKLLIALTSKIVGPINLNIELPIDEPTRPNRSESFLYQTFYFISDKK